MEGAFASSGCGPKHRKEGICLSGVPLRAIYLQAWNVRVCPFVSGYPEEEW